MLDSKGVKDITKYIKPTEFFDFEHPSIKAKFVKLIDRNQTDTQKAQSLFYFVRDKIKYRIFLDDLSRDLFKASATLERGYGFCIPKANLLIALGRAAGIPARLHFADIRNHQLPQHILERLGSNLMTFHGYVEFYLDERWIKLNPAFDIELCEKYDIIPVEFIGKTDALFHHYDQKGRLHIDYINDHGIFDDMPYETIVKAFKNEYK